MPDSEKKNNSQTANSVFRQKTINRITAPEQLTDYLKVTSPGVWIVLVSAIILIAVILVWATIGELETTVDVDIIVQDNKAFVVSMDGNSLKEGMTLRIDSEEYQIARIAGDGSGISYAYAEATLPDGSYKGKIVTESIHPIDFLLK